MDSMTAGSAMTRAAVEPLAEIAVRNAHAAENCANLAWAHLESEYTQDIDKVLATLATDAPLAWTLPNMFSEDGGLTYLTGQDIPEIRQQYENLRQFVQIWDWQAILEIRQSWYMLTHGVVTTKAIDTGETSRMESVTMFPIGADGILGELQIGDVGVQRENRWPEVPQGKDDIPLPQKRLEALSLHNTYLAALRSEDVDALVAAHRSDCAATIRDYTLDQSRLLNATGADGLRNYFESLFQRYRVRDVRLVNRVLESWYVFAELHWLVEERSSGRSFEFCTAETSPLDPDGKFWVRTGAGTDLVESD